MRMRLKRSKDGTASYSIGNGMRWMYALFSLFMGYGTVSVLLERSFTPSALFPILLLVIGIIGLGYRESWVFTPSDGTISYTFGIYHLVRKKRYSVDDVERLEITHFVRGKLPAEAHARARGRNKAMVVFSLHMKDDSVKDIEIIPERTSGGHTEAAAQVLADIMHLPYHADREPDTLQQVSVRDL